MIKGMGLREEDIRKNKNKAKEGERKESRMQEKNQKGEKMDVDVGSGEKEIKIAKKKNTNARYASLTEERSTYSVAAEHSSTSSRESSFPPSPQPRQEPEADRYTAHLVATAQHHNSIRSPQTRAPRCQAEQVVQL